MYLTDHQLRILVTIAQQAARFYGYGTALGVEALKIAEAAKAELAAKNGQHQQGERA